EDGIRDFHVTGVQTCALPILFLNSNHILWNLGYRPSNWKGNGSNCCPFKSPIKWISPLPPPMGTSGNSGIPPCPLPRPWIPIWIRPLPRGRQEYPFPLP